MSTITLTFDREERAEAMAAIRGMRLLAALNAIDEIARTALKHDGDLLEALEVIRGEVGEAMEGLG